MSIGSDLKNARESKKKTLDSISQKTRIHVKYLEALEENRFDIFPSQTYVKSFIRAYAKEVGLDPAIMTRQFKAEVQPDEVRIEPMNAEAEMERGDSFRAALNLQPVFRRHETHEDPELERLEEEFAEPFARESSMVRRPRRRGLRAAKLEKWAGQAAFALLVLVAVAGIFYFGRRALSHFKWNHPVEQTDAGNSESYEPVKVVDKYQHLILKGLDKSWVQVTMDDGQATSEIDLDEGEVKTYQAVTNFKLKIGNAGGVDIQYNGKSIGILGTTGQVVEITLPPVAGEASDDSNNS